MSLRSLQTLVRAATVARYSFSSVPSLALRTSVAKSPSFQNRSPSVLYRVSEVAFPLRRAFGSSPSAAKSVEDVLAAVSTTDNDQKMSAAAEDDDMGWGDFGAELEARALEEEEEPKNEAKTEDDITSDSEPHDTSSIGASSTSKLSKKEAKRLLAEQRKEQQRAEAAAKQQSSDQDMSDLEPMLSKKERKALERAKKREGKKNSQRLENQDDLQNRDGTGEVLEVNEEGALRVFKPKSPLLAAASNASLSMLMDLTRNAGLASETDAQLSQAIAAANAQTSEATAAANAEAAEAAKAKAAKRVRESESIKQQIEKLRQEAHEKTWLEVQAGIAYAGLFRDHKTPIPQLLRQVFHPEVTRRFGPTQLVRIIEPLWDKLIGIYPAEVAVRIARTRELGLAYLEGQKSTKMPKDARQIQDDGIPVVYLLGEEKLDRMLSEERERIAGQSKDKERKANTFAQKDIVFQVNIRPHDLLRKCLQATQFLLEGHPIKLQLKILGYEKLAEMTDLSKRGRVSKNTTLTIQEQIEMAQAELEKEKQLGRESLLRAYDTMLTIASYLELIRTRERDEESFRQRLIAEAKERGLPVPVFDTNAHLKRVKRHEGIDGLNKSTVQRNSDLDEIKRMCEAETKVPQMIANDVASRNPLFVCIDRNQITKTESFVLYPSSRKHVKVATMGVGVGAVRNYTIRKLQIQLEELAE